MSLRHTLLAILDWTPLHGYALRETARTFAWLHPMTNANIYPALRDLEQDGLIVHEQEIVDGRLRKVYTATDGGRDELLRWLSEDDDQPGVYRDPGLLKISLLRGGTLEQARIWVSTEVDRVEASIIEAERVLKEGEFDTPKYTLMVASHGADMLRLRARFLRRVLDELDNDVAADVDQVAS